MSCKTYCNRGCVHAQGDGKQPKWVDSCYTSSMARQGHWVPICALIHSAKPCKYRITQPATPASFPRYLGVVNLFLHVSSSGNKWIAKKSQCCRYRRTLLLNLAQRLLKRITEWHCWPLAPAHKWYSVQCFRKSWKWLEVALKVRNGT